MARSRCAVSCVFSVIQLQLGWCFCSGSWMRESEGVSVVGRVECLQLSYSQACIYKTCRCLCAVGSSDASFLSSHTPISTTEGACRHVISSCLL